MNNMALGLIRVACAVGAVLLAVPASAFPFDVGRTTVYEYVNDRTNHYFLVADEGEKAYLDAGGAGGGWRPTGHQFGAYVPGAANGQDVCRFYAAGPNTHFFTASAAECNALRANGLGWAFEGIPFKVYTPVNGACSGGGPEVHRLYNNRFQFNDTNHRYVAEAALRDDMVRQGWTDESVVFCTGFAQYQAGTFLSAWSSTARPVAECEDEDLNRGGGSAMGRSPAALPSRVGGPYTPVFHPRPHRRQLCRRLCCYFERRRAT